MFVCTVVFKKQNGEEQFRWKQMLFASVVKLRKTSNLQTPLARHHADKIVQQPQTKFDSTTNSTLQCTSAHAQKIMESVVLFICEENPL